MNIARVGLLVVAVAAAGGAAFLVRTLTSKPAHETVKTVQAPSAHVLVAARVIDPGTSIKSGDFRWQSWPADGLSANFMTQEGAPKAIDETLGTTVRMRIDQGEPVTSAKLVNAKDAGFMAAMLSPGMRAISTKIDEETAAGGFILPGDRVDIVMTRRVDRNADGGGGGEDYESQTVLRDVKVLAIGQTVADTNGEKIAQGKTATLELSPAEGELLALAGARGSLTLLLRSAANGGITAATGPAAGGDRGGDGSIRLVRYSHPSRVTPVAPVSSGDGR